MIVVKSKIDPIFGDIFGMCSPLRHIPMLECDRGSQCIENKKKRFWMEFYFNDLLLVLNSLNMEVTSRMSTT